MKNQKKKNKKTIDHLMGKRSYKSQKKVSKKVHKSAHKKPTNRSKVLVNPTVESFPFKKENRIRATCPLEEQLQSPEPILKRKRKPRTAPSKMYFTQDTENAVVEFNNEECMEKREKIYREKIEYPFQKLVENIYNTFKFSYFETGPQDVQKECLSHLVANISKYKKSKGRAFAYFSIIAKHYLILLNNTNYKKFKQSVEISEERDEHTIQLQHHDKHHAQAELSEFIRLMVEFWENNVQRIFSKQRDLNIANAVIELFRKSDRIEAFNKKALYLYIREISACKTQQITKVINKMKQYQKNIYKSYNDHGTVNIHSLARA